MSTPTGQAMATGSTAVIERPDTMDERSQRSVLSPVVDHTVARLIAAAGPSAIFGTPVTQGEITVIPCGRVSVGLGFGGGNGGSPDQAAAQGEGAGAGGGAGGRPVAAIIISPEGVRVKPILDVTRIVLSAVTSAAAIAFFASMAIRRRRA